MGKRRHQTRRDELAAKIRKLEKKRSRIASSSSSSSSTSSNESCNDESVARTCARPYRIRKLSSSSSSSSEGKAAGDLLALMGEDPTTESPKTSSKVHTSIANRLNHYVIHGHDPDNRNELLNKYLMPENCHFHPPEMNPEIVTLMPDLEGRKDKFLKKVQSNLSSGLNAIARVANTLKKQSKNPMVVENLPIIMDTGKIIADTFYMISTHRKFNIFPLLNPNVKKVVANSKPDKFLCGENFSQEYRDLQNREKAAKELQAGSGSLGSGSAVPSIEHAKKETDVAAMASSDIDSLEDARKLVRELRQKTRAQSQQILAWRRAYKMQEILISRLQREKSDQLKFLSSKLLLFQSRLIRKQKDISAMLSFRENIIHRQKIIIESLSNRLIDNGLEVPQSELTDLDTNLPDLDSLNDSDSAVVMEDIDSDSNVFNVPKFRSGSTDGITVVRSISDAIDPSLKYTSLRRNNGFLRRPEILETVYSVEEDGDEGQSNDSKSEANKKRDAFASRGKSTGNIMEGEEAGCQKDRAIEEKVCEVVTWPYTEKPSEESEDDRGKTNTNQVKTYNRVMSNHRSVTKPKDVKYKRINKAKSKSLEELRGRLKNWVEQGSKLSGITLEHSQSYA